MSIFTRFFGDRQPDDAPDALVAVRREGDVPTLQVLFTGSLRPDPTALTAALRAHHPTLAAGTCEIAEGLNEEGEGKLFGLAGWGPHVLKLVGFDLPMPSGPVEACLQPSHYSAELKDQARAHRSHLLLWYAGEETEVVEQFVALAAFAGVLAQFGASVVLNETAHTSFPAAALAGAGIDGDILEELRTLPLPVLYCGFVKYNIPNDHHVWMRTHGASVLGLPDLASYTNGHHEGERYFSMFDSILRYMLNSGRLLAAGHTMQLGPSDYLRCRAPRAEEPWGADEVLVLEIIRADQINR